MDNATFLEVIDQREINTDALLKRILTILLFDEGKWSVFGVLLVFILWMLKRLVAHFTTKLRIRATEEEEEEDSLDSHHPQSHKNEIEV
jgi:hypothetical protein